MSLATTSLQRHRSLRTILNTLRHGRSTGSSHRQQTRPAAYRTFRIEQLEDRTLLSAMSCDNIHGPAVSLETGVPCEQVATVELAVQESTESGVQNTAPVTDAAETERNATTASDDQTAEIHGQKWNDLNGDGIRDPGEPGLNGWTIELYDELGEFVATETTADRDLNSDGTIDPETEQGLYSFTNLNAGRYSIREVRREGWQRTSPNNDVSRILITEIHREPSVLEIQNVSDVPVNTEGWQIVISNGYADYDINDVNWKEWQLPETIAPGEVLYRTSDEGDNWWGSTIAWYPHYPGWAMILDNTGTIQDWLGWGWSPYRLDRFSISVDNINVDGLGTSWSGPAIDQYGTGALQRFGNSDDNTAATVVAWEAIGSKGIQNTGLVFPFIGPHTHVVDVAAGESVSSINFGDQEFPTAIRGQKWNDVNRDGIRDTGESGINGWEIELRNSVGELIGTQTTTDLDLNNDGAIDPETERGVYEFSGLDAGTYIVDEVDHIDWKRTFPDETQTQLLVGGHSSDNVVRFDDSGTFVDVFASDGGLDNTTDFTYGPDGNLYVVHTQSEDVLRYHGQTGDFIDVFATGGGLDELHGITFGPDGNLYVSGNAPGGDHVLRYDGLTGSFIDVFVNDSGLEASDALEFGPDGNLYVVDSQNDAVFGFDGVTGDFIDVFASGGGLETPTDLAFGPDSNLYVASFASDNVLRFDGASGEFIDVFATLSDGSSGPNGIAFGPSDHLYVAAENDHSILKYDGTTGLFVEQFASHNELRVPSSIQFTTGTVDSHVVAIEQHNTITDINFGSHQIFWSEIHGQKWNDLNGDGTRDPGEPGLDDWIVELYDEFGNFVATETTTSIDLDNNGTIDPDTERGLYSFTRLEPGTYIVGEVEQLGWQQTSPLTALTDALTASLAQGTYSVTLAEGEVALDISFGNHSPPPTEIHGQKWNDRNGNGVHDSGEVGLNGWEIQLRNGLGELIATQTTGDIDLNNDGTINPETERGLYQFTEIHVGTYIVEEINQAGWEHTFPIIDDTNVLVASWSQSKIARFDDSGKQLEDFATGNGIGITIDTVVGPDGNLYVTSASLASGAHNILQFDGTTGALVSEFTSGHRLTHPQSIAFGPDGNLYVADFGTDSVLRFDGVTGTFIDVFTTGSELSYKAHLEFGPDGNLYVAGDQPDDSMALARYDGVSGAFIDIFTPGNPWEQITKFTFGPSGDIYAANYWDRNVQKYSGTSGDIIGVFASDNGIDGALDVVFAPDGSLHVASRRSQEVLQFDGTTGEFIKVFAASPTLQQPAAIAFVNNSHDTHVITTQPGQTTSNIDFGNQQIARSEIHGQKWHDVNGDGIRNTDESGLDGWTIEVYDELGNFVTTETTASIDLDNDGTIDPDTERGLYSFTDLDPGSYVIGEIDQLGWQQTSPQPALDNAITDSLAPGTHAVTVSEGEAVHGIDFGNYFLRPAEIHGQKWNDINGDGIHNPGEPGLNGWVIEVYDQDSNLVATQTTTDVDLDNSGTIDPETERGLYSFTDLHAGTYVVGEVEQFGWNQTSPQPPLLQTELNSLAPGTHTVTVAYEQSVNGIDFGNRSFLTEIRGQKWNDLNGNGARDSGEPGLNGWEIKLYDDVGQFVATQLTSDVDLNSDGIIDPETERGVYLFSGLLPGTYIVEETEQTDWRPTYPEVTDGHLLVGGQQSNNVVRFDNSGTFTDVFSTGGILDDVTATTIGPDGNLYVASSGTQSILRYHGVTGAFMDVLATGDNLRSTSGITFGPDGNLYASIYDTDSVLRYDGTTGQFIDVFATDSDLSPNQLSFGPDGNLYVASGDSGNGIFRFDGITGAFIDEFVTYGLNGANDFLFHPDGYLYVAGARTNNILRFVAQSGRYVDVFAEGGGLDWPTDVSLGPDGNMYASSSLTDAVLQFDGLTGTFLSEFATSVELDGPISLLFVADKSGIQVVTTQSGQTLGEVDFGNQEIAPSVISGQKWDDLNANGVHDSTEPGLNNWQIELYDEFGGLVSTQTTSDIDFNNDGTISPETERGLYTFTDLPAGTYTVKEVQQVGFEQTYPAPTPSELLVSASGDAPVRRYDQDGSYLGAFTTGGGLPSLPVMTLGPNGHLYTEAGSLHNEILRFDGKTGNFTGVFAAVEGLSSPVIAALEFHPDGNLFVIAGHPVGLFRVDGSTGEFIDRFGELSFEIDMTIGPDNNIYTISGEASRTIRRFNGTTGEYMGVFARGDGSHDLAEPRFGPDGNLYAVETSDQPKILRFDGTTGQLIDEFVTDSHLDRPFDLAFGPMDNHLYIADYGARSVLRYDGTTGEFIDVFASGTGVFIPFELLWTEARDGQHTVILDTNDSATNVDFGNQQIESNPTIVVDLRAVSTPTANGSKTPPNEITDVLLGNSYYVEVWAQETHPTLDGISSGQVDLSYLTELSDGISISNDDFDLLPTGSIDDVVGIVDNLGGGTSRTDAGTAPQWARLGYVEVMATAEGLQTIELAQGELPFRLIGGDDVDWADVDLTDVANVNILPSAQLDFTIVREQTETDANGEIIALPDSEDFVHEWEQYYVEIWGSTDGTASNISEAMLDITYDTSLTTAVHIEPGPAFALANGTIDDATGVVDDISVNTGTTGLGDDQYILLATVRFESVGTDQAIVDEVNHIVGPYDLSLELSDAAVTVGGVSGEPTLADAPATEMWAVPYDIDDNNRIDFGDFSFFAPAFGMAVGGTEPPYTWWADFDKSGTVDFGDFSYFAPNFGKSRLDNTLTLPPNFATAPIAASFDKQIVASLDNVTFYNNDAVTEDNFSPDQNGQRSVIKHIQVELDGPATITDAAVNDGTFQLTKLDTGEDVPLVFDSSTQNNDRTVVVLTFATTNASVDPFGSLIDGNYEFRIDGAAQGFDADHTGTVGGTSTTQFHRLFGDTDGDRDVDEDDNRILYQAYFGEANYRNLFDLKQEDDELFEDMTDFFGNYGKVLNPVGV